MESTNKNVPGVAQQKHQPQMDSEVDPELPIQLLVCPQAHPSRSFEN